MEPLSIGPSGEDSEGCAGFVRANRRRSREDFVPLGDCAENTEVEEFSVTVVV